MCTGWGDRDIGRWNSAVDDVGVVTELSNRVEVETVGAGHAVGESAHTLVVVVTARVISIQPITTVRWTLKWC